MPLWQLATALLDLAGTPTRRAGFAIVVALPLGVHPALAIASTARNLLTQLDQLLWLLWTETIVEDGKLRNECGILVYKRLGDYYIR